MFCLGFYDCFDYNQIMKDIARMEAEARVRARIFRGKVIAAIREPQRPLSTLRVGKRIAGRARANLWSGMRKRQPGEVIQGGSGKSN